MDYIRHVITSACSSTLFIVFAIAFAGYVAGRIQIKGVGLGTAGVFLAALVFGHFGYADGSLLHAAGIVTTSAAALKRDMSLVQNIGLLCFVTAVGFIAGPGFFHNLRKNARSYVLLAAVIIGGGSLVCVAVSGLTGLDAAMAVGLLSGALTTTPGFAAAQDALAFNDALLAEVSAGYAIAYPFGVIGVVLFVQVVPKLLKADIARERELIRAAPREAEEGGPQKFFELDPLGIGAFSLAVFLGVLLGKFTLPLPGGAAFSLGNTGGALLMALALGHFGHIGRIAMRMPAASLKTLREFGLAMFLIGAGVPGGAEFMGILRKYGAVVFVYGALMTLVPMVLGFVVAKYVAKLHMFNSLGSITGGMTSTPALGALIATAGTDDVAASYASTYPVALVLIVLACQFIVK